MNNSVILQEAFKQLKLLEETDISNGSFPLDPEGMEGAKEFLDDDPSLDELSIVDMDADSEEELEEATHVGDVILECKVCHSRIFLDPEEVVLSDDKLWANEDLECPYCYCTRGYKIIGQVAPYEAEPTVEIEPKEEPEEVEEEEVVEESFRKDYRKSKKLKESIDDELTHTLDLAFNKHHPVLVTADPGSGAFARVKEWAKSHSRTPIYIDAKSIDESDIDDVANARPQDIFILNEINRADLSIRSALLNAINRCKGFVVVVNNPSHTDELDPAERSKFVEVNIDEASSMAESLENIDIETEHDIIHVKSEDKPEEGEETMLPVDDSLKDEILSDEEEEEEEPAEEPLEDEIEDIDIEDFDEESFDNMGESYLRKVYDNVESFNTTRVVENGNGWIVEGIINFKSGKSKNTEFIFEAATLSKGNILTFKGGNPQITRGNKAFAIRGKVDNKKFITESFRYNYKQKDTAGKSVRVYGTIKK